MFGKTHLSKSKESQTMTVCIAALAQKAIFTISDRMLSVGDIQYESSNVKTISITPSILLMIAGNDCVQGEILKVLNGKNSFSSVESVALKYKEILNVLRHRRIEQGVLVPLGLDYESFLAKQSLLHKSFVTEVTERMSRFFLPEVSAIVAGKDETGHHIYMITPQGQIDDMTRLGYAAIGIGERHACLEFVSRNYSPSVSWGEALSTLYMAKKSAEVAPTVGKESDLFAIMDDRIFNFVDVIETLEKERTKFVKKKREIELKMSNNIKFFLEPLKNS